MQNQKTSAFFRIVIAVIVGEILLVLGTTLAQEVFFDGISWRTSSDTELFFGGLGSFLAAVVAGAVAYLIVKRSYVIPIIVLTLLVAIETVWLIQSGRTEGPTWFDIAAAGILIIGFWVGRWFLRNSRSSAIG